ncbi:MAG: hypothetical protein M3Y74_18525 [Chloroflexota bacterium]|nr:hypothetical protein [Chloroflexota bacterium]
MTPAAVTLTLALTLVLAPTTRRPTRPTPLAPVARTAHPTFTLRQYPDAGYPGDRGFVVQVYPSPHAATTSDTTNNRTSTLQPGTHDPGALRSSPRGTWTRLTMTPSLCVAVAGGVKGRTTVMATDESVSGVGSPTCVAEVRWAQAHAVAALRAVR